MSVLDSPTSALAAVLEDPLFDEAEVAAAAFLARYSGRTLDAYRYDLRTFFQWAADAQLAVLEAQRPHIELYRTSMEERQLAPSTIDRRLSTVCGFYRFAHIDGRVPANPAQYVRRPKVHPSEGRGLDRREFGTFLMTAERCDKDQPPWLSCSGSTASGSARRAAPMFRTSPLPMGTGPSGSSARATSPWSSRSCREPPAPSTY
jgi:integrase